MAVVPMLLLAAAATVAPSPASHEWIAPVPGPPSVVRGFDPPSAPWGAGHRGVDLAATPGAAVRAAGAGRVTFAGVIAGRGVVVVSHRALRTTYEPLDAVVDVGAAVAAGDVIGRLTLVGSHCAPHACLHWGLLRGTDYLDPLSLLRGRRIRLLPLSPAAGPGGGSGVAAAPVAVAPAGTGGDRSPPLITAMGAATTGAAGAAALWWRRRGPP